MSLHPERATLSPALVEAWRADVASPVEVRRRYARFLRSRAPRRRASGVLVWVLLGVLLGVGLAQAATSPRLQSWLGSGGSAGPTPTPTPTPLPRERSRPGRIGASPGEPRVVAPPVAAASSQAAASSSPARGSGATPAYVEPAPSSLPALWQEAAHGLRERDFAQAERALLEIERSSTVNERDAARLARAQLLLSHGRTAQALSLLRELSQRAQSEQVRSKAAALAGARDETETMHRSSSGAPVTQ